MGNYSNCGFYSCCCCCCCCAGDFDKTATSETRRNLLYTLSGCWLSHTRPHAIYRLVNNNHHQHHRHLRCGAQDCLAWRDLLLPQFPLREHACGQIDRGAAQPQYVRACACVCFSLHCLILLPTHYSLECLRFARLHRWRDD